MAAVICKLADECTLGIEESAKTPLQFLDAFSAIVQEFGPLRTADFPPQCQIMIAQLHQQLPRLSQRLANAFKKYNSDGELKEIFDDDHHLREEILAVFWQLKVYVPQYLGQGGGTAFPRFLFINDVELRQIIERDFRELTVI